MPGENKKSRESSNLYVLYNSPRLTLKGDMVILQLPNFDLFQKVHRYADDKTTFSNYTSRPFTLSSGYNFRLIVYTYGHGMVRGKYMSAYIQMGRSDDHTLIYPFYGVITFVIFDQSGEEPKHISKSIRTPSGTNASFDKPQSCLNIAYGIEDMVPLDCLNERSIVYDNVLLMGVAIRYNKKCQMT